MAKHNNPSIAQDAARILNSIGEFLSDEVEGPVAVIPISPTCKFLAHTSPSTSASSNTAATTPSDKDFYLTYVHLAMAKDATCDAADGHLFARVTVDGVTKNILILPILTLTAQQNNAVAILDPPVKCDRNTALQLVQPTFTVGKFIRSINFIGYTVETTR